MNARREYQTMSRTQRVLGAFFATVVTVALFNGVVSLGTPNQDAGSHVAQTAYVAQSESQSSNR